MNSALDIPALVVRATPGLKRQTALGLAVPFLIPAALFALSFIVSRTDYQSGYRVGALVALLLALYTAISFSGPLWRPFFTLTETGILVAGGHTIPWSLVKAAAIVSVERAPIFGFRLHPRGVGQLSARSRRAVTAGGYWPRARLAAAAPADGITPDLAELREALAHYGVTFDDRPRRVDAE